MKARTLLAFALGALVTAAISALYEWTGHELGFQSLPSIPAGRVQTYTTAEGIRVVSAERFTSWTRWVCGGWEWIPPSEWEVERNGLFARWMEGVLPDPIESGEYREDRLIRFLDPIADDPRACTPPPWIAAGSIGSDGWPVGVWTLFAGSDCKIAEASWEWIFLDQVQGWYPSGAPLFEGRYHQSDEVGVWTVWFENGQKMLEADMPSGPIRWWKEDGTQDASREGGPYEVEAVQLRIRALDFSLHSEGVTMRIGRQR
jgi:hypothetical protein